MKPVFALYMLAATLLSIESCALILPKPSAVTVPDVARMSQARYPSDEIIERMRASGTVYRLSASELAYL